MSKDFYEKRAQEGYGLLSPDGHVIRIYEHILKSRLPHGASLLDFGCWNGTHAKYFSGKGLHVVGVDIVEAPILAARQAVQSGRFELITDQTDLPNVVGRDFEVIFANQVMYFLDDATLAKRLQEFRGMLKPGGLFVATMISSKSFYARHRTGETQRGLDTVTFTEPPRLAGKTTHIRFTQSPDHLKEIFAPFEAVQIGRYECDLDSEHSTEHFIFFGA